MNDNISPRMGDVWLGMIKEAREELAIDDSWHPTLSRLHQQFAVEDLQYWPGFHPMVETTMAFSKASDRHKS